jgi:hypothetical protein
MSPKNKLNGGTNILSVGFTFSAEKHTLYVEGVNGYEYGDYEMGERRDCLRI